MNKWTEQKSVTSSQIKSNQTTNNSTQTRTHGVYMSVSLWLCTLFFTFLLFLFRLKSTLSLPFSLSIAVWRMLHFILTNFYSCVQFSSRLWICICIWNIMEKVNKWKFMLNQIWLIETTNVDFLFFKDLKHSNSW